MNLGAILADLVANYFRYGWPFFLGHLAVTTSLILSLARIIIETRILRRWSPSQGTSTPGRATPFLDQFVKESQELGQRGIFVPMTDFSDRLDSIVSGMVTEYYERTNLLLIVGIAGTLFGVFEFAIQAPSALSNQTQLGVILSQSLAKAFPVGFVGLGLMFVFQFLATFPENKLKQALADATQKAIDARSQIKSPPQVLQETADQIKTATLTLARDLPQGMREALRAALQPIENLETTLQGGLRPVVEQLAVQLDSSLELVKEQFRELRGVNQGFTNAVSQLNESVGTLQTTAGNLKGLLETAPQVLASVKMAGLRQQQAFEEFQANLRKSQLAAAQVLASLESVTGSVRNLPADLLATTQATFAGVAREVSRAWLEAGEGLKNDLRADYQILFGDVRQQAEGLQALVTATSAQLSSVAESARQATADLQSLRTEAAQQVQTSFKEAAQTSAEQWRQMTQHLETRYHEFIGHLQAKTGEIQKALTEAAANWHRVAEDAGSFTQELRKPILETMEEVEKRLSKQLQVLVQRYPDAVRDIQTFTESLGKLFEKVQLAQASLDACAASLVQGQESLALAADRLAQQFNQPPRLAAEVVELRPVLVEIRDRLPKIEDGVGREIGAVRVELAAVRRQMDELTKPPRPLRTRARETMERVSERISRIFRR